MAEPFAKHQEQLAANPALQLAAATVLLTCCLPAFAAMVSAELAAGTLGSGPAAVMLQRLLPVLRHRSLVPAIQGYLRQPSAALGVVKAAARLVEALPQTRPADMAADLLNTLRREALGLLRLSISEMDVQPPAGASSSGGAAAGGPASSGAHQQAAAWRLMVLVPRLTGIIQALAVDEEHDPADPDRRLHALDLSCTHVSLALRLLGCLSQRSATTAQRAIWAAAAAAGIRLQPTLLRLDASFRQRSLPPGDSGWTGHDGAKLLSLTLWQHLRQPLPGLDEREKTSRKLRKKLALRVWELHSSAARLAHFFAAQSSLVLPFAPAENQVNIFADLVGRLACTFQTALDALPERADGASE